MTRGSLTTIAAAVALHGHASVCAGSLPQEAIEVLFTAPAEVPVNGLVVPPSPTRVTLFAGQPRIADDGTWYALYRFPLANPNNPFESTRDFVMLKDGVPWVREGLQLPPAPLFLPAADLTFSQQPFFDVSISGGGAVAQIIRGTDEFTTIGDGTPDAFGIDVEDVKFDILLLDRVPVLAEGGTLDVVPGLSAPDNRIDRLSTVKAVSNKRLIVSAELAADAPFSGETRVVFELTDPGTAGQAAVLRLTDDDANPVPGLGLNISTFNGNEEDVDANAAGSILIGIDIEGEPFNTDGAILFYDALADTYRLLAREGDPSPLPGRVYDSLFNSPLALNDSGDTAFLASVDGDTATDGVLIRNNAVVIQESATVGTGVPGPLQLGFANANIEMDREGNIIWYGAWNELKANVCPDNADITSTFVIYEGLFFNDEPLLEGGVTTVENVTIDGTLYPELVVKDLPNTGFAGFHVSPDGRWLVVHALLAEPDPDLCAFSVNNDATPVGQVLLRIDLDIVRGGGGCNAADLAEPFGVLDLADVQRFVFAFTSGDADADLAEPAGVFDLADVQAFVGSFAAGCP